MIAPFIYLGAVLLFTIATFIISDSERTKANAMWVTLWVFVMAAFFLVQILAN